MLQGRSASVFHGISARAIHGPDFPPNFPTETGKFGPNGAKPDQCAPCKMMKKQQFVDRMALNNQFPKPKVGGSIPSRAISF